MVPSKRFKPVQRVAESQEQKAAKAFGQSQRTMQDQEARLEVLKRYHEEYLQRFQETSKMGMSVAQLHEYRAFLAKLEAAIKAQEKIVLASQQNRTSQKAQWQQKHMRSQVLDKVAAHYANEERKSMESREQKEMDERSQRGPAQKG